MPLKYAGNTLWRYACFRATAWGQTSPTDVPHCVGIWAESNRSIKVNANHAIAKCQIRGGPPVLFLVLGLLGQFFEYSRQQQRDSNGHSHLHFLRQQRM